MSACHPKKSNTPVSNIVFKEELVHHNHLKKWTNLWLKFYTMTTTILMAAYSLKKQPFFCKSGVVIENWKESGREPEEGGIRKRGRG